MYVENVCLYYFISHWFCYQMRLFTIFVPFLVSTKYTLMSCSISRCKSIWTQVKKTLSVSVYAKTRWYIYVYLRITKISNQGTELLKISNIASDSVVLIFLWLILILHKMIFFFIWRSFTYDCFNLTSYIYSHNRYIKPV